MVGQSMGRGGSVYNSLAASAFIILCINPFSLWDAGFQLSYAAVLSIIVFMQPVYGLLYVKNKWLDAVWKLNAVTISAQILTLPVILFHFHQFPNLFLLTNMVAVPLSSIILGGELVLLAISWAPVLAGVAGAAIGWLIWVMNSFIQWCGSLPFSVSDYLQMNMAECWCLFAIIICTAAWLLAKKKRAFTLALTALLVFGSLRLYAHAQRRQQQLLVVYHVPQRQAIDFIDGGRYYFLGDSMLLQNGFLKNFHLKPARIELGISPGTLNGLAMQPPVYRLGRKTIFIPGANGFDAAAVQEPFSLDLVVLSGNTRLQLQQLLQLCTVKQVVADASNRPYKVEQWRRECDSLHIPFHRVVTDGAFVLDCNNP
jgi:competence protein ComEC